MKYVILLAFLFVISGRICIANDSLSYDQENEIIEYCNAQGCREIKPPMSLQRYIYDGYTNLTLGNLSSGKYILVTLRHSAGANRCYISYKITDEKVSLNPVSILPKNRQLCIHEIKGDKLINSYKDGAKWYSELYEYRNREYQLLAIDECIGCGVVYRRLYVPNVEEYHLWVSDNKGFENRIPIVLDVNKKSFIYTASNENSLTNMYLVAGDSVNILDENEKWVRVRFKSHKVGYVIGWILKENTNYSSLMY